MSPSDENSLGSEATFAGPVKRQRADMSLGDERTLGVADAAGVDTVIADLEVVELEARYRIEGTLGQGGMGAVLLATDTRLDRKVAIKRILGEAARSKTAIMRFLTEAKAIAALNHPNVVQIHDYGRATDGPFLIMEYVDGGSLADRCKDGGIPLDEAVDLACQLCDGLAKAHGAGIVHRDIKPANVLLTKDGHPKLTDFGLAKAEAADHGMTMTGAVMGTPDFMPPEQRRDASEVDHRSDLWSLAATVYQMVTGRSPKIIRFNDIPAALQDVLAKALEDTKDDRYQSAREFRDALKTSVRVAAVAVHEGPAEGKCPACGVQNDTSRKFCRGCGESLVAPCLRCGDSMPMWDDICGSCGGKQTALVEERLRILAGRQAEAEGLLGDFDFERAKAIAVQLLDETHPKLRHVSNWAQPFLEKVEASRAEQTHHAVEAIVEAGKHQAAYDYTSAELTLKTVPASLRETILPGAPESAAKMLARLSNTIKKVERLDTSVRERIAAKDIDHLLPEIDELLALRPDREDVKKIRVQLLDRQQKQAAARDEAIAKAKASLAAHDYEGALVALASVSRTAVTPQVEQLREKADGLHRRVKGLARKIRDAVAAKNLDGLLGPVDEYLALKPADGEVSQLRQSVVDREKTCAAEIASRLDQARKLQKACRFEDVVKLLEEIPAARRSAEVNQRKDFALNFAQQRRNAIAIISAASPGQYGTAIEQCMRYEELLATHQLSDTTFNALLSKAKAGHAKDLRWQQILYWMNNGPYILIVFVAVFVCIALIAIILQNQFYDPLTRVNGR